MILQSELLINRQGAIYSSRTAIKYSKLVLNAHLQDIAYDTDGHNYTLQIGITHPSSSIDVSMVSHVANSRSAMSALMEMNYLTMKNHKKNMMLRGEIEKIRKRMNMEVEIIIHAWKPFTLLL